MTADTIMQTCAALHTDWTRALLDRRVSGIVDLALAGGLLCPGCARLHGRAIEAIHPFLREASRGAEPYLEAARGLYRWADQISWHDGSWPNEVAGDRGVWKGTTVPAAIAIGEALRYHGHLLEPGEREAWRARLRRAVTFVNENVPIDPPWWNINYPAAATAALAIASEVLEEPMFRRRAREIAVALIPWFTPNDRLLAGEGHPQTSVGARGCRPIDISYNVGESLPNLVLYARLTGDREIEDLVVESLGHHLELMLPDGAWDNSFGSRSYKWTYFGGRTTGSCVPALAMLADRDARFLVAVDRHLGLLESMTHGGLLDGGPHLADQGEPPCVQHTVFQARSLASLLDAGWTPPVARADDARLPRDEAYGVRHLPDVSTHLVAEGPWRATITCYSFFDVRGGHPSGGALSLLWHEAIGPLVTASMNQYVLKEPGNMPFDRTDATESLTPRLEHIDGKRFTSIDDVRAVVALSERTRAVVRGHIVSSDQAQPPQGPVPFALDYVWRDHTFEIVARLEPDAALEGVHFVLPIVSRASERVQQIDDTTLEIEKSSKRLRITASVPFVPLADIATRVYNHVPGHQAVVLRIPVERAHGMRVVISLHEA